MKFKLIKYPYIKESLLLEGKNVEIERQKFIDRLGQGNKSMAETVFNDILKLDPTYTGGNTTGIYTQWIINIFSRGMIERSESGWYDAEKFERIDLSCLLSNFDKNKKYIQNKDIMSYKSIEELQDAIDSAEMSSRQKERAMRNSKDYKVLAVGKNYTVYTPLTYEGSLTLGKGTEWCTADSRTREYYDRYTKDGPLYIFISNTNPKDKKQLHIPSEQFLEADDRTDIDLLGFFNENQDLLDYFEDEFEIIQSNILSDGFTDFIDITEYVGAPAGKAVLLYDGYLLRTIFDGESHDYKKSYIYRYLQAGWFARDAGIKIDYDSIDLLSIGQAEKLPLNIRKYKNWWWLRSPGGRYDSAAFARRDGSVNDYGVIVNYGIGAVRPALVVNQELLDKLTSNQKTIINWK